MIVRWLSRLVAALAVAAIVLAAVVAFGVARYTRTADAGTVYVHNFEHVAYHDLEGKPAFKMAMQVVDGRWYLYLTHFWVSGWSIVEVTDPQRPRYVKFIPGPPNTSTLNIQVSNGLMLTALEKPATELLKYLPWEGYAWLFWRAVTGQLALTPSAAHDEGVWVWDARDPENPARLGAWRGGGTGTHRNFYAGGRYAILAGNKPGFRGHQLIVLDLADPSKPVEAGRWFDPEQIIAEARTPMHEGYYLHGPAHIEGDRAYAPYGIAGAVILDISKIDTPREVGRLNLFPKWGSTQGVHSFIPLPRRKLAIINSEAHDEACRPDPAKTYTAVIDIADESAPKLVSFFPEPAPPANAPYRSFCALAGRAGVHNQHHANGEPHLFLSDTLTYLASFSAGLRLYDTSDPKNVREIAYFIPPNPKTRYGPFPTGLVVQSEDVLVDARGYAYLTDKNQGLYIVRATAPEALMALADQAAD